MSEQVESSKRPKGLFTLCVLTILYSTYNLLTTILLIINGKSETYLNLQKKQFIKMTSFMKEYDPEGYKQQIESTFIFFDAVYENFVFYHTLSVIFFSLGVAGAILMFKGSRLGFHFYIIYSFLITIQSYFILGYDGTNLKTLIFPALISILFIYLYSRHLSWMTSKELEV